MSSYSVSMRLHGIGKQKAVLYCTTVRNVERGQEMEIVICDLSICRFVDFVDFAI